MRRTAPIHDEDESPAVAAALRQLLVLVRLNLAVVVLQRTRLWVRGGTDNFLLFREDSARILGFTAMGQVLLPDGNENVRRLLLPAIDDGAEPALLRIGLVRLAHLVLLREVLERVAARKRVTAPYLEDQRHITPWVWTTCCTFSRSGGNSAHTEIIELKRECDDGCAASSIDHSAWSNRRDAPFVEDRLVYLLRCGHAQRRHWREGSEVHSCHSCKHSEMVITVLEKADPRSHPNTVNWIVSR